MRNNPDLTGEVFNDVGSKEVGFTHARQAKRNHDNLSPLQDNVLVTLDDNIQETIVAINEVGAMGVAAGWHVITTISSELKYPIFFKRVLRLNICLSIVCVDVDAVRVQVVVRDHDA